MSITRTIMIRSFVKPFYLQNAGFFIFLFIILFGAVGTVDGAGLFDFHYSLIRGLLGNAFLFGLVLFAWFLYMKKTEQFIIDTVRRPDFSFLNMLSMLDGRKLYWLLVWVQFLLFLPVIFYALIIIAEGLYLRNYFACLIVGLYLLAICMAGAGWYFVNLRSPGKTFLAIKGIAVFKSSKTPYWVLLLQSIGRNKKLLYSGIKLFSCGILYGLVINQTMADYDLRMILLFFSLGILGHGLIIHYLRNLEETRFTFYRSLPVSLFSRFAQYCLIYFMLLVPEWITLLLLTPKYLHVHDAFLLGFLAFSMLLFMNSLLFIRSFKKNDYLKITLLLFLAIYFSVLTTSTFWLCILLFFSSAAIFHRRYYRYGK
jgi:hypothetical protein